MREPMGIKNCKNYHLTPILCINFALHMFRIDVVVHKVAAFDIA